VRCHLAALSSLFKHLGILSGMESSSVSPGAPTAESVLSSSMATWIWAKRRTLLTTMISTSGAFQSHGRKGWTMKDGSAPVLKDSDYDQIITETLDEFGSEDFLHTITEIDAHRGIPPDIDRRLLARSRERTGGNMLTDEQLKALREKFTNSIKKRVA
jgi:hypothetical protein